MIYAYIAGPYTAPDPVINTANAIRAGEEVRKAGVAPYVPHLTMFWHLLVPNEYEVWLEHDIHWLRKCDALIRLPGPSLGADAEVVEAERLGIAVYYSVEAFIQSM